MSRLPFVVSPSIPAVYPRNWVAFREEASSSFYLLPRGFAEVSKLRGVSPCSFLYVSFIKYTLFVEQTVIINCICCFLCRTFSWSFSCYFVSLSVTTSFPRTGWWWPWFRTSKRLHRLTNLCQLCGGLCFKLITISVIKLAFLKATLNQWDTLTGDFISFYSISKALSIAFRKANFIPETAFYM